MFGTDTCSQVNAYTYMIKTFPEIFQSVPYRHENIFRQSLVRTTQLILLVVGVAISSNSFAQGELPVDMYRGTGIISIPLFSIESGSISDQLNLNYNATGVQVTAKTGQYGVNWSVSAGGYVKRQVRGLPDDYSRTGLETKLGWLYQNASNVRIAADVATLPNTSDLSGNSPCADETADATKLASWLGTYDSEPDVFEYSIGGYSGKFVFDNAATPKIRLIPHQDVFIQPKHASTTDKTIIGFTITTSSGVVYTLTTLDQTTRWITDLPGTVYNDVFRVEKSYYKSLYNYQTTFNAAWHLTTVKSPEGDVLNYEYASEPIVSADTVKIKVRNPSTQGYTIENLYINHTTGTSQFLTGITTTFGPRITMIHANQLVSAIEMRDARDGDNSLQTTRFFKKFVFRYSTDDYGDGRKNLVELQEISGADNIPPYKFEYWGSIPSTASTAVDAWGYYNAKSANKDLFPKLYVYPNLSAYDRLRLYPIAGYASTVFELDGADRTVNPAVIHNASLYSISFPWGGTTTLEYEPNQYFDATANANFYAGGIRIKSATYVDGTNPDAAIRKTLTYVDALNRSSGVLINTPSFGIPLWEHRSASGDQTFAADMELTSTGWEKFIGRTNYDLSPPASITVGYKEVKVFRDGAGYVQFEYDIPNVWNSAANGVWQPTQNKIARPTCHEAGIANYLGQWMYPYSPNADVDYMRGLQRYKREYNNAGVKVRETYTTYQSLFDPQDDTLHYVYGVRYDRYANADNNTFLFGKYSLITGMTKVVKTESVTTFNTTAPSVSATEHMAFFYEGAGHSFLTRTVRTGIDGEIVTARLKYPLDYGTIPANADTASAHIKRLQLTHRTAVPIESYTTRKKPNGVEKVVGGSITKFSGFGRARSLPQSSLVWRRKWPKDLSAFTASNISGGVFSVDSSYTEVTRYLAYDTLDKLSSWVGEDRREQSVVWSSKIYAPVATIVDARADQMAFSDFEFGTEASFSVYDNTALETGIVKGAGRSGSWAIGTGALLTKTISKRTGNYVVTGWWNRAAETMTVQVAMKDQANGVTYYNQNFVVSRTSSVPGWDFFKFNIPMTSVTANMFNIILSFGTSGPVALIDDMGFLPATADLTTYTYQFPYGASSVTTNNKSAFTLYDKLGRVKYVLDKDRNIRKRQTYEFIPN